MSNKNYAKEYYKRNRDEIIKKQIEYYRLNRPKYLNYMTTYNAEYYKKNKFNWNKRVNNMSYEEKQKYRKEYYQKNKDNNKNKNKNIKLNNIENKEPNFLISFN